MPNPCKLNLKMNNYLKAKEEGINDFGKIDMGKQRIEDLTIEDLRKTLLEVINKLPSFAEKIKEGRDKDLREYLEHRPNCNYYKNVVFDCDCGLVKLLSSDSQTIK